MAADKPDAVRPRRAPVRPSFDPMTQPWVPSVLPFGPVPEKFLTPSWIRQVLTGSIQRPLNIGRRFSMKAEHPSCASSV